MNNFKVFTQPFNWFMGFLLVAFMSGCNGSSGNGSVIADITAPTVISIAPADLASSIAINTNITATFSEAMNASTINSTTFTVKLGSTPVAGAVTYVGTTAIFKPTSVLIGNTAYTATITTGVKDLAGNALAATKTWTFTTNTTIDNTAPTVSSVFPADTATGVLRNANIVANFSETMDPSTINISSFTLMQGSTPINGAVTSGTTATFHPTSNLTANTLYTATITTGVKDLAGNPLATAKIWSFTTGSTTGATPANLGEAGRFVILSSQGVSTTGVTAVSNGDIGVEDQARSFLTGFTASGSTGNFTELTGGTSYAPNDANPSPFPVPLHYATLPVGSPWATTLAMINQSRTDLGNAYTFLATDPNPGAPTQVLATELGTLTLTPGVYKTASNVAITTGTLTLDAQGDPNAVWIFSIDGTLTTGAPGGSMAIIGNGQAKNVFWRVAGTTTIGAGTTFYGNVLDYATVNLLAGANVTGRLFSKTAAVTLISDTVTNAQ
jgi:hypothetical protein